MKTIPLEQLDHRLAEVLEEQTEHEAVRLTKGAHTVAFLLRLPEVMKDTDADFVFFTEDSAGRVFVIVEAKHASRHGLEKSVNRPVFGAGRGTLTIVNDDDEHLKDFKEYME